MPKPRSSTSDTAPGGAPSGAVHLRNIGPVSAQWLETVGVYGMEDLQDLGPVETYLRVRDAGFKASLHLLWALQGALMDIHWADVPPEIKDELKAALRRDAQTNG